MRPSWIQRRVKGVTTILEKVTKNAKKIAWAAGTVAVTIAYPLALSVVEERVVKMYK